MSGPHLGALPGTGGGLDAEAITPPTAEVSSDTTPSGGRARPSPPGPPGDPGAAGHRGPARADLPPLAVVDPRRVRRLGFGGEVPPFIEHGRHFFADDQISRSGAFASTGLGADGFGDTSGPIIEKIRGSIKADGAASGTYSATVTLLNDNGAKVASCDTGAVRWTVRSAKGRVYAGSTSQDMPIVVQLNRRRTKVTDLLMGWGATCSPTGDVLIGERLVNFPISGNAFGDSFSDELDLDGGGKRKFNYALKGRLGATNAVGRLSVRFQDTDSSGTSTCTTGPIRWSARTG